MSQMISISAYNDHEKGRLDRLRNVGNEIKKKNLPITAIHDHKGTLYVNWTEAPLTGQLMQVMAIWHDNAEHLANHYVNGKELILDVEGDNPFG